MTSTDLHPTSTKSAKKPENWGVQVDDGQIRTLRTREKK